MSKGFFAYPAAPSTVGDTIEQAVKQFSGELKTWRAMEIVGYFIANQVIAEIDQADVLAADISVLNFNVTYEIGYAIGRSKKLIITKSLAIIGEGPKIQELGIFDTLGFAEYQNSLELCDALRRGWNGKPIDVAIPLNIKAPVYTLEPPLKTDWARRITSRIKKAGYIFRNFDPAETPRLSANDAISQVAQSYGVVVPLISLSTPGCEIHNLRAAFIAGLSQGMNKPICVLQHGDDPVPLDYRDFVHVCYHPNDVNDAIATFASEVAAAFQSVEPEKPGREQSFLRRLNLGATSAENEMRDLAGYYLETDQYLKSLRGEAHLVVGRKGSGKSAIFLQIRDRERELNRARNVVLDLKPDGYKLIKFKEQILSFLEEGTYQHTITAFWEYVLLLEITYKILEKDRQRHLHDHRLFEGYRELLGLYKVDEYDPEGDFSERMSGLMERVYSSYRSQYGDRGAVRLSSANLTQLLYRHDVRKLRNQLLSYMEHKGALWLLFDNIDKGWPTSGLQHEDLLIVRALIDATRKIEREFSRNDLSINTIVFLRNDVYELLVRETSDRGKEASVLLDWTDADLLRELVRLRIVNNGLPEDTDFKTAWLKFFISHVDGEETSQYLIERSLMRPRFLLNLINQCKSFAINLNHDKVDADDIKKGVAAYSTDLLRDIGYELVDVSGATEDVLYAFIECEPELTADAVNELMNGYGLSPENSEKIFRLLIWYGFFGVKLGTGDVKYIYDVNYKMPLMEGLIRKAGDSAKFVVNQAFRPCLMIPEH